MIPAAQEHHRAPEPEQYPAQSPPGVIIWDVLREESSRAALQPLFPASPAAQGDASRKMNPVWKLIQFGNESV